MSCNVNNKIDGDIMVGELGGRIDNIMLRNAENGFSGYLMVVKNKSLIYSKGFGFSEIEAELPIDQYTVFDIGSLTKQFTAAAILKLEMEGKLTVNSKLGEIFNNVPEEKQNINLHQLLTHTSGFAFALGGAFETVDKNTMLERAFESELRSQPGEEYHYSHLGYNILGAVIEEITKGDYETYLNRKLFHPSGMKFTGYIIPDWNKTQISHGYNRETDNGYSILNDWGKPTDYPWSEKGPYWFFHGSGGILASPEDIYKWDMALNKNNILSEEAKEKFFNAHVNRGEDRPDYYGYGWAVSTSRRNTKVVTHNAGNRKFYSELMRYLDDEVSIYVCSNNSPEGITGLTIEIARLIFVPDYKAKESITKISNHEKLPDDIIGERVSTLLSYSDNTDNKIIRSFVENNLSERLIEKYSINRLSRFLKFFYRTNGKTEIRRIISFGSTKFEIYLYSQSMDKWILFELRFTDDKDKFIDSITFDDDIEALND